MKNTDLKKVSKQQIPVRTFDEAMQEVRNVAGVCADAGFSLQDCIDAVTDVIGRLEVRCALDAAAAERAKKCRRLTQKILKGLRNEALEYDFSELENLTCDEIGSEAGVQMLAGLIIGLSYAKNLAWDDDSQAFLERLIRQSKYAVTGPYPVQ